MGRPRETGGAHIPSHRDFETYEDTMKNTTKLRIAIAVLACATLSVDPSVTSAAPPMKFLADAILAGIVPSGLETNTRTPTDESVLTYESSTPRKFQWQTLGAGSITADSLGPTEFSNTWDYHTATESQITTLYDDQPTAWSFDAAGAADILNIVTTNGAEAVTMSGALTVTGTTALNGTTGLGNAVDDAITLTGTLMGAAATASPAYLANGIGVDDAGCLVWEGSTLDAIETRMCPANATVSDNLIMIANGGSGTLVQSAVSPLSINSANGQVSLGDVALTTNTSGNYAASVAATAVGGLAVVGAAGEGTAFTVGFDYTTTLASDPALVVNTCVPASTGFLCEGPGADGFEGLLTWPVTASDKTITFPDATGTVAVSGTAPIAVSAAGNISLGVGGVTALHLQNAAADLGGLDVTVNFGNTNGAFNTNITTDGTMTTGGGAVVATGDSPTWTAAHVWTLAGTENLSITSDLAGAGINAAVTIDVTPSATAATWSAFRAEQESSLEVNGIDNVIFVNNADDSVVIGSLITALNTGGGGYTNFLSTPSIDISGAGAVTGATGISSTGTIAFDAGEIGAVEIANYTAYVDLPVHAWSINVTDGAFLTTALEAAGATPILAVVNPGINSAAIQWDDDSDAAGPDVADENDVGAMFTVPGDYVSGGAFRLLTYKDAHTVGVAEVWTCNTTINGLAGVAGTATIDAAGPSTYVVTPTDVYAPLDDVQISCQAGDGDVGTDADDVVNLIKATFSYTAGQ